MVGRPNTFEQGNPIPYPQLNEIRRIHISNPKISPTKAINFMLPYRKTKKNTRDVALAGAILGRY